MEFEAKMKPFLTKLGITDVFSNAKANLTDIADDPLYGIINLLFKTLMETVEKVFHIIRKKFAQQNI